jgi:hypothetical protein
MASNFPRAWTAVLAAFAATVALVALTVILWPPTLAVGVLLVALYILPLIAVVAAIASQRRSIRTSHFTVKDIMEMSDDDLRDTQLKALAELENSLELRELRLARRLRTAHVAGANYLDLLDPEPSDEELGALLEQDRKLLNLIENESRLAFDRILENRYAKDKGVDSQLIMSDIRDFVEKVATLYRPDSEDILLETEIELMAKSLSSASLHLLMVIDGLPLNLKSYNVAKIYRLIRRGVSYYGTYKAFRPYLEHGLNSLQLARLAMGINPIAVGTAWLAGKLATHGAKAVGERLLQRTALQLLNDFIRVIGFESAMMYGGGFQHRDANWIFGAALVNLEISRSKDLAGRDAALKRLCSLVLRNEFDRVRLLTHLSKHRHIEIDRVRPQDILTRVERENIARELAAHCRDTGADLGKPEVDNWRQAMRTALGIDPGIVAEKKPPSRRKWSISRIFK